MRRKSVFFSSGRSKPFQVGAAVAAQLEADGRHPSMLAAHGPRILLSAINSGATMYDTPRRGLSTFRTIADYPLRERGRRKAIAELTVEHSVPDIAEHVVQVERAVAGSLELEWARVG